MRKILIAVLLAFAVTLAVVIGNRMSSEAMAVVVGVVCGVAAGIPMSVLLILMLNRRNQHNENDNWSSIPQQGLRSGSYPPVVVIQGGTPAAAGMQPPFYATQPIGMEPVQRQFHIVGQHEE